MYIAIDIGGTTTRVACTSTLDSPEFIAIKKFPTHVDYTTNFEQLTEAIKEIVNNERLDGIGCGIAGPLSPDNRIIAQSPNLPLWIGKPFAQDLEKTCNCTVVLANDAVVAALGEAYYGYAKNKEFVYLIWGTGFGGTRVYMIDGKPFATGFEPGHHMVEWNSERLCGCGQYGCAESFIGGRNIQKHYNKQVRNLLESEWQEVYERATQTILNVISMHHTSLIMMGSGIALNQKPRVQAIAKMVESRLRIYPMPEIRVTELGDNIGLYGALGLLH